MANIEQKIEELVKNNIEDLGYILYDVRYVKEAKDYFLKIFIDSDKGISLEDCEKVSNAISDTIDMADYIKEQYFLEVSSPGVERILRKTQHLSDNLGKNVEIKLFKPVEGKKEYVGILKNFDEDIITILGENEINLDKKNVAQIKIKYEW
ncbi:MAG: ribosome maturation factor RimP [Clostridia bacterium]|nr:ribosome maturation factor RimP [Clostridia bacterium]